MGNAYPTVASMYLDRTQEIPFSCRILLGPMKLRYLDTLIGEASARLEISKVWRLLNLEHASLLPSWYVGQVPILELDIKASMINPAPDRELG